jgi:uncharacterized protein YcfJ
MKGSYIVLFSIISAVVGGLIGHVVGGHSGLQQGGTCGHHVTPC